MNVAIVGSSGYIATYLIKRFRADSAVKQIVKIDQTMTADVFFDLLNPEKFDYDILRSVDYIVFTAAISSPDQCAANFELCWKINVEGTKYFIREAVNRGCKVLFFSSDSVFGNIPGAIYTEESELKGSTPYGKMKRAVENEFAGNSNFKSIRLSYVVSANDRFISYCLNCIRNKESAEIFHPFYRNCITVSDVEDVVLWFAFHFEDYKPFVLNVAGQELVSRVRIADEINRILGNKLKYTVSQPKEGFFVNRPKIAQMKSLYLEKYKILKNVSFTEKLQKELEGITA